MMMFPMATIRLSISCRVLVRVEFSLSICSTRAIATLAALPVLNDSSQMSLANIPNFCVASPPRSAWIVAFMARNLVCPAISRTAVMVSPISPIGAVIRSRMMRESLLRSRMS